MNPKALLSAIVLMLMLITQFNVTAQNIGTKMERTNEELKKAEEVVDKSKVLFKKLFKKKNKPEKQIINTNSTATDSPNPKIAENRDNEVPLSKEAEQLFKNYFGKATNNEKNEITSLMNIKATKDAKQFYINDPSYTDYTFSIDVYPLDLNHDGIEEIATVYGHPAISGNGPISTLFIKNPSGHYVPNFGFTCFLIILPNYRSQDFPDIVLGGPGFEFPIWKWNGKTYVHDNQITNDALDKLNSISLEQASKIYTDSLNH